ncbi:hypothetical protein [Kribbella alba]
MRPADRVEADRLLACLDRFENERYPLPGIKSPATRDVLVEQIIDSERRNRYIQRLRQMELSPAGADPASDAFDPLKAAILNDRGGNFEEACWMVFLYVHFGKHLRAEWRYAREVYGKLGQGGRWDWVSVVADTGEFRRWLDDNRAELQRPGVPRGFGNHRKYESLAGSTRSGTGEVVSTYVQWVVAAGSHADLFGAVEELEPTAGFDALYRSMARVSRFGRVARFDYLSLVSKLELANIVPAHTYLVGATGPLYGAQLLLGRSKGLSSRECQDGIEELEEYLKVGPDVLEDSLCNWQKSSATFRHFRG